MMAFKSCSTDSRSRELGERVPRLLFNGFGVFRELECEADNKGCFCKLCHVILHWLQIWFQVKAANPHLSVCQIGATIGRMWRELSEAEKQRHLEEFQQDKVDTCL